MFASFKGLLSGIWKHHVAVRVMEYDRKICLGILFSRRNNPIVNYHATWQPYNPRGISGIIAWNADIGLSTMACVRPSCKVVPQAWFCWYAEL